MRLSLLTSLLTSLLASLLLLSVGAISLEQAVESTVEIEQTKPRLVMSPKVRRVQMILESDEGRQELMDSLQRYIDTLAAMRQEERNWMLDRLRDRWEKEAPDEELELYLNYCRRHYLPMVERGIKSEADAIEQGEPKFIIYWTMASHARWILRDKHPGTFYPVP